MPGYARREIVAEGEVGAYHCMARCVRRAFLCGSDLLTGRNFDHRKEWVRDRLQVLARSFAVEIGGYAVMDNHLHVVVRQRPDLTESWSAEEVTRRWRQVFARRRGESRLPLDEPTPAELAAESADVKLVSLRRARLANLSWFMRTLCEPIARRANREDHCKGRFWEGRFKCQALLDDAALLACTAYVDLNPVRAGVVKAPESARYTSLADRVTARKAVREDRRPDRWLAPIATKAESRRKPAERLTHQPWLAMPLDVYLKLVDWVGRQVRPEKRGRIPAELAPILARLHLAPDGFVTWALDFGRLFKRAAGSPTKLAARAGLAGKRWFQGVRPSRAAFAGA